MTEVQIPGGTAVLRDPARLSVRQKRPLQILKESLGTRRFTEIIRAQEVNPPVPVGVELTAQQRQERQDAAIDAQDALQLTKDELDVLFQMTDATIFALLESWTLDAPLPATLEQVGDMDGEVYDVLAVQTARLQADFMARNGFGLEAVQDLDSPTGASGESDQPSPEAATSNSTGGPPTPGGSTGTGPSWD